MLDITHLYAMMSLEMFYPINKPHMPSVYGLGNTVDNKVKFSYCMSNRG